MKYLQLLLILAFFSGCTKHEKNYICGVNPELNVEFDGGFVALANVFIPDGDGVDDAFGPVSYGLGSIHLTISDKKNKVIFESTDLGKWWDGHIDGAINAGSYPYTFEAVTAKGEHISKTGQVCVITENSDFCYQSFSNFKFISLYSNGEFANPDVYKEKYQKCD